MEAVAFIALGIFVFCLGWVTGNFVEWILNARERRWCEKKVADWNKILFLEERENRE